MKKQNLATDSHKPEEDDDFEFGGEKSPKEEIVIPETKTPKEEAPKADEPIKGKFDSFEDEEDETPIADPKKEETKKQDPKKEEEKKEEEKKTDESDDFFSDEEPAGDNEKGKEETKPFSFLDVAKKLEVEIDSDSEEKFLEKVNEKIAKAKQDVDVSKFNPDAQLIIKHLNENDGKIEDFLLNKKIINLQGIIDMDAEEQVRIVKINNLISSGFDESEAIEKADAEIATLSTRELKNQADEITANAQALINKEIESVVNHRQAEVAKKQEADKARVAQEVETIKSFVSKQEEFLGIALTPKAKSAIIADIEKGEFDKVTNTDPAKSKYIAYMLGKYGSKIEKKLESKVIDADNKAYNAGLQKSVDVLHNTKESAQQKQTGHQNKNISSEKGNYQTWSDDLFEEGKS